MKNLKLMTLFAAVAMLFVACEDNSTPAPTPGGSDTDSTTPDVVLSTVAFEVDYEGGLYDIDYTIVNPIGGMDILAVSDQKWVNNFEYETGKLRFTVDFNNSFTSRMATIEIRYPSMPNPVLLIVTQKAATEASFTFDITDTTTLTCSYTVTPKDNSMYYITIFSEAAYMLNNNITTAQELFDDDYAYFIEQANINNLTAEEYLVSSGIAMKGRKEYNSSELGLLAPGGTYVAYAYGIEFTATGYKQTTPLQHQIIETELPELVDAYISVTPTVSLANVNFNFDPGTWKGDYNFEIYAETSDLYLAKGKPVTEKYTRTIARNWVWMLFEKIDRGYSIDEVLTMYCLQGKRKYNQDLTPDTNYIIVAYAVDTVEGYPQLVSTPTITHFRTGSVSQQ